MTILVSCNHGRCVLGPLVGEPREVWRFGPPTKLEALPVSCTKSVLREVKIQLQHLLPRVQTIQCVELKL